MNMSKFYVLLNNLVIEEVFYNSSMDEDDVKRSLIDHDGFDSNIKVIKEEK
jgi:hypothetical protein